MKCNETKINFNICYVKTEKKNEKKFNVNQPLTN